MTSREKSTSQPLPAAKGLDRRAAALRSNLAKRKQQARARDGKTEEDK